jgi:hypothetical protein
MNWNKINLDSPYESSQDILDGYDSDTILLEVSCNLKDINRETVRAQFEASLKSKIKSAREIFDANLDNYVNHALKHRNSK